MIDLQGREISCPESQQMILYIYANGDVEKKLIPFPTLF